MQPHIITLIIIFLQIYTLLASWPIKQPLPEQYETEFMKEEPQLQLDDHYPQDRKQNNRDEKLMQRVSSSSTSSVDPEPA
jgi:hypothetical protein